MLRVKSFYEVAGWTRVESRGDRIWIGSPRTTKRRAMKDVVRSF